MKYDDTNIEEYELITGDEKAFNLLCNEVYDTTNERKNKKKSKKLIRCYRSLTKFSMIVLFFVVFIVQRVSGYRGFFYDFFKWACLPLPKVLLKKGWRRGVNFLSLKSVLQLRRESYDSQLRGIYRDAKFNILS